MKGCECKVTLEEYFACGEPSYAAAIYNNTDEATRKIIDRIEGRFHPVPTDDEKEFTVHF